MGLHTLRADFPFRLPVKRPIRRVRTRPRQPVPDRDEVTPVLKLVGVAVLGWFGLMVLVTVLAV